MIYNCSKPILWLHVYHIVQIIPAKRSKRLRDTHKFCNDLLQIQLPHSEPFLWSEYKSDSEGTK